MQATWSFVKLEYYPEVLLDAVTRVLTQQSAAYDGKALSNVLWALARHGPLPATPAMLKAVAAELGPRAKVCACVSCFLGSEVNLPSCGPSKCGGGG